MSEVNIRTKNTNISGGDMVSIRNVKAKMAIVSIGEYYLISWPLL